MNNKNIDALKNILNPLAIVIFSIKNPKLVIMLHITAFLFASGILFSHFQTDFKKADPRDSFIQTLTNSLFDNSIQSIIGKKGTGAIEHQDFQKNFGSDEFIQLVISGKGTLKTDDINKIIPFITKIEQPENSAQVIWIGKLPHAPDQLKFNQPLVTTKGDLQFKEFLARTEIDPLASRLIRISKNRWDMSLYIAPQAKLENDGDRVRFTELVRNNWKNTPSVQQWKSEMVGIPIILSELRQSLIDAIRINFPLVNFLVIALCWVVARKVSLMLVFFLPLLQSEIWLSAAYLGSGHGFNYITGNMATIIMIIGAATSIHLLSAWMHAWEKSDTNSATLDAFQRLYRPCLIATGTTIIALISLGFSSNPAIKYFGLFSAFGLAATLFCSFTLIPALLSVWSYKKPAQYQTDRLSSPLLPLPYWAWENPKKILTGALVLTILGAIGVSYLEIGTHIHGYFSKNSDYRKAVEFAENRFPGYIPYELIVSWPKKNQPDNIKTPDSIIKLSNQIKSSILTGVNQENIKFTSKNILGLADFLTSFCLDPSKSSICPEGQPSRELKKYFISSKSNTGISPYITDDEGRRFLRTTIFHNPGYASDELRMMKNIKRITQKQVGNDVNIKITGIATLWVFHDATIARSLINSFIAASFIIFIIMTLFYRKIKPILISLPSNILPILLSLAVAGIYSLLFSAKLTTAALMFSAVGVGIIVDDTLYFMLTYQKYIRRGLNGKTSLDKTISSVGPGIILTAICLTAGTGTLLLGELIPIQVFGGMLSMTVFLALFTDLLILPALCRLFWNPRK